jgi:hypothetical protein
MSGSGLMTAGIAVLPIFQRRKSRVKRLVCRVYVGSS